jgi:hypothetical protein
MRINMKTYGIVLKTGNLMEIGDCTAALSFAAFAL